MNPALQRKIIDSGDCVYCGLRATCVDHILSRIHGGTDDEINLVPCCQVCNSSKSHFYLSGWDYQKVMHGIIASPKVMLALLTEIDETQRAEIALKIINPNYRNNRSQRVYLSNLKPVLVDTGDEARYSLKEIIECRIIPMEYQALRKARQRDENFPSGICIRGAERYTKLQIQSWFNAKYYNRRIV